MSKSALIAESNKFFLATLEESLPLLGFTVVGKASKLSDISALALKTKPDLLLFDIHLSANGIAGRTDLKDLQEQLPEMKVIALGIHEATDYLLELIKNAGFDGFWSKYGKRSELTTLLTVLFP